MTEQKGWEGRNRRKTPRNDDIFYRVVNIINILSWIFFVAALVVFHYARPELISGVQAFWGMEGRQNWSQTLSFYLVLLLTLCTLLGAFTLLLKRKRNRRKNDFIGINLGILLVVAVSSLAWIYSEIN